MSAKKYKYDLGQKLVIGCSNEEGQVIARSDSAAHVDQYLLRYKAGDGRAVEAWWDETALMPF